MEDRRNIICTLDQILQSCNLEELMQTKRVEPLEFDDEWLDLLPDVLEDKFVFQKEKLQERVLSWIQKEMQYSDDKKSLSALADD